VVLAFTATAFIMKVIDATIGLREKEEKEGKLSGEGTVIHPEK
jgi:ammonia channel protein AmtB